MASLSPPRRFLLGTDWWTDYDDAVAIRILCRAALAGKIELVGIGINACMEQSVASLDAFLCAEGLSDVRMGIDTNGNRFTPDQNGRHEYVVRLWEPQRYAAHIDALIAEP